MPPVLTRPEFEQMPGFGSGRLVVQRADVQPVPDSIGVVTLAGEKYAVEQEWADGCIGIAKATEVTALVPDEGLMIDLGALGYVWICSGTDGQHVWRVANVHLLGVAATASPRIYKDGVLFTDADI